VTASAGNHGQAVAWAAAQLGIEATIVLPIDAVPVKSAAVTVAAVLGGLLPPGNGPIALILSGGNVDPGVLIQALAATSDAPAAN